MRQKFTRREFVQTATLSSLALATSKSLASKGTYSTKASTGKGLTQFVDVFIGTGGHGHTYPGATVPFGMVQLSPDTGTTGWDHCSGYHISDTSIMGFSHTHLSGTGAADLLDVLLMPTAGEVHTEPGPADNTKLGYRSAFSHDDEHAEPGYYSVLLKDYGIRAELTATARVGLHRYTFPADKTNHIVLDLAHGMGDYHASSPDVAKLLSSELHIVGNDTVTGGRRVQEWAPGRYIYFAVKFSKPFASAEIVDDTKHLGPDVHEANGTLLKCVLSYPTTKKEVIYAKVGLSAVSADNALKNLQSEIPAWDFEGIRSAALAAWEKELAKIKIETSNLDHKKIFYTALYHSLVAPTLFSDVDGQYRGTDLKVHTLPAGEKNYTTYSLWDTYRALHPLYTFIQRERLPDMANSLIRMAEEGPDGVPVWPLQAVETGCMIGYHSDSVLAEAYVKKIPGVDYAKAYQLWRKRAMDDDYRGLVAYRKLGYVPCDKEWEAVSKTLEYCHDDWSVAHLALAAGAEDDYKRLLERSRNYKNVFDSSIQFVRGRYEDGKWAEPFDPRGMGHFKEWRDFTESNAWQATFLNQHDVHHYMTLFGGEEGFLKKLDELFNQSSELPPDAPPDIAGMVGQYAHGNEPCHHMAYLYAYAGVPHKMQARVRSLLETMYHNNPDGLAGNEDCGQMSAWFILSALGFYPVDPVSGNYVIGSPLFDRVSINLGNGKELVLETVGNGSGKPYVQSVMWNGKPYTRTWFSHEEIAQGGKFTFHMGDAPNLKFGAAMEDRPPSFV